MKLVPSLAFVLSVFLLSGLPAEAAETFTIKQDKPKITELDNGASGSSEGDVLAFEAKFKVDNGTPGIIRGVTTTVDVPHGADDPYYDRIEDIVVDFGSGDTIVITGLTQYPRGKGELNPNVPVVRAITGGTGRYLGARGQISSFRQEDGTYKHFVILID